MKKNILKPILLSSLLSFTNTSTILANWITITNKNTKPLMVNFQSTNGSPITLNGYNKDITINAGGTLEIKDSENVVPEDDFLIYGTLGFARSSTCKNAATPDNVSIKDNPSYYTLRRKHSYMLVFKSDTIGTTCIYLDETY